MSETYCPECKQNVRHDEGECCPNCGYEFEVLVSRRDLELLLDEVFSVAIKALCCDGAKPSTLIALGDHAHKFRQEHLGDKEPTS